MKYVIVIVRVLLGLVFVVFGSNAFLKFMPVPEMHGQAGAFMTALLSSGYMYVIAVLQSSRLVSTPRRALRSAWLTLLGPVIVNIVLYHVFLDPQGMPVAIVISALALFFSGFIASSSRRFFSRDIVRRCREVIGYQLLKAVADGR